MRTGDEFIFTEPERGDPIWGLGSEILWISGEPMLICASPGIGKTTIAQQIALGMLDVMPTELLGYPIRQIDDDEAVFYVAADRPAQARRSFRRMVNDGDRETLRRQLVVWEGPIKLDQIARNAQAINAPYVFIDSLGAVAGGDLSSDTTGMEVYQALQEMVAIGLEVCVLHHNRKRSGQDSGWRGLDEVYGSRWLTAVPGSVLYMQGKQGEPSAKLRHLKMPAAPVGPMTISHEHHRGRTLRTDAGALAGPSEEEIKDFRSPAAEQNRAETWQEGVSVLARTLPGGDLHLPLEPPQGAAQALGVGGYED